MKCTKCGFISFDFNQVCPKCNKGLADEQRRMNLPSFRPDPPSLLGRLMGESYDESDLYVHTDNQSAFMEDADRRIDSGFDDSLKGLGEDSISFEDEEDLDVVFMEPDQHETSVPLLGSEQEDQEPVLDFEDISGDESEKIAVGQDEEDVLEILSDDLILEESMIEASEDKGIAEKGIEPGGKEGGQDEEVSFSLDDISFEDLDIGERGPAESSDLSNGTSIEEDVPAAEFDIFKNNGTMEAFYLDSNAEGLTKEIDMKKLKKDRETDNKKTE